MSAARPDVPTPVGTFPPPAPSASEGGRGPAGHEDERALRAMSDMFPAGPDLYGSEPVPADAGIGASSSASLCDGDGDALDVRVTVRITAADKAAMDARSRVLGVSPSAWHRAVIRDALDARRAEVEVIEQAAVASTPDPVVSAAVEQLRRVGVNLNQAVRGRRAAERALADAVQSGQITKKVARALMDTSISEDVVLPVVERVDDLRTALGDRTR